MRRRGRPYEFSYAAYTTRNKIWNCYCLITETNDFISLINSLFMLSSSSQMKPFSASGNQVQCKSINQHSNKYQMYIREATWHDIAFPLRFETSMTFLHFNLKQNTKYNSLKYIVMGMLGHGVGVRSGVPVQYIGEASWYATFPNHKQPNSNALLCLYPRHFTCNSIQVPILMTSLAYYTYVYDMWDVFNLYLKTNKTL